MNLVILGWLIYGIIYVTELIKNYYEARYLKEKYELFLLLDSRDTAINRMNKVHYERYHKEY